MRQELKTHVEQIHSDFTIVDAHFDMLGDVLKKRRMGYTKVIERDFIPDFISGGVNIVVASLFVENQYVPEMAMRNALDQISALYEEIEESPDKIIICKTYQDILTAIKNKQLGVILSFEGAEPIGNDLKLLRIFYELGVRILGLVWSRRNYAGDGCHFQQVEEGQKGGLTDFGVKLVREAEKLGMFIDVSHLNDEGFWDVMKIAKKPVIASHSNSRSIVNHPRNLTDEQIKAVAKHGGVIGMNAYSDFVSEETLTKNAEGLVKHVLHIVDLVGIKHIGLGFDFCDLFTSSNPNFLPDKKEKKSFDVIKGHKNIKKFTERLIIHGFKDEEIKLILGGNFLEIYKQSLTKIN
ncbi:dipeptidase [Clostridium akagii]|uniref:dipeptidase n=1 Tax=Clostridium akagii TaxID=91623 RepID=UPI00068BCBA2|nr:dipeptidase [Clostridium akagii]